jgi:DNA polymerase III subunit epsilon
MPFKTWLRDRTQAAAEARSDHTAQRDLPAGRKGTPSDIRTTTRLTEVPPFALPEGPFRFIALDVETANSDAASICQIGLACVRHDGTVHVTSSLVDPEQRFSGFNVTLHGIGPDEVRGAATFPVVLAQIAPLLGQQLIIQHSPFDKRAMYAACRSYGIAEPDWSWADSVQIARRAWPEFRGNGGHGLGHLKQALSLDFEHHDAGEDAKAAALVVLLAEERTGLTLAEMIAPPRKKTPKTAQSATPLATLRKLDALVARLQQTRPLSQAEVAQLRRESGLPTPPSAEGVRAQLVASDHDLCEQVERLSLACHAHFETGEIPASHAAWRVAILLSKGRHAEQERAFLTAWCRHFAGHSGGRFEALAMRACKRTL